MRLNGDLLIDDDLTVTGDVNAGTLNASQLALGTVPDARLSANVLTHTGGYPGTSTTFLRGDNIFATPTGITPSAHHTTHEPAGSDQIVSVDASLTTGADLIFKSNQSIRRNTVDGTDNGSVEISGGGAASTLRGARLIVHGNEDTEPGALQLYTGNVFGSYATIYKGDGVAAVTVSGVSGQTSFAYDTAHAGNMIFTNNNVISRNTADGSDSGYLDFCGGGGSGQTRGAFIRVGGNESGNVGSVQVFAGNVSGCNIALYRADANYALFVDGSTGATSLYSTSTTQLVMQSSHANGTVAYWQTPSVTIGMMGSRLGAVGAGSAGDLIIHTGQVLYLSSGGGSVLPHSDNGNHLGLSANRWIDIYAVNGTIQTSDKRQKSIVGESLGLDFIRQLKPFAFRWKDEERVRYGLGAQDILALATNGSFIEGSEETQYSMNYSEFIAPLVRAVQELAIRMEDLAHGHE